MDGFTVTDVISRRAAVGLRFWDAVTGSGNISGLRVTVRAKAGNRSASEMAMTAGGVYHSPRLPGLAPYEFDEPGAGALAPRAFDVQVTDPEGRFLPVAFACRLPHTGVYRPGPDQALLPELMAIGIPLFSTPARRVPSPMAIIRADLQLAVSGAAAAWCLVTVTTDGKLCGAGLADAKGRLLLLFPYPERQRPALTSPPQPPAAPQWPLEFAAFPMLAGAVPQCPTLEQLSQQAAAPPRSLLLQQGPPKTVLPTLVLEDRVAMILRSRDAGNRPLPIVLVDTP